MLFTLQLQDRLLCALGSGTRAAHAVCKPDALACCASAGLRFGDQHMVDRSTDLDPCWLSMLE